MHTSRDLKFVSLSCCGAQPDVTRTHVIESLGPTNINDCCFINNQVSSAGVVVYGNRLVSSKVHASNSGGALCQFASVFQTLQQYKTLKPRCVGSNASSTSCAHLSDGPPPVDDEPVTHFVPFTTNALEYDEAFEIGVSKLEGGCNRVAELDADGPDAQNTEDEMCLEYGGCHISHSTAGEFLVYKFAHDASYAIEGKVFVDVTARVASTRMEKQFRLELMYNGQIEYSDTFASPGLGYKEYRTITWSSVPLRAEESTHSLRFWFVNGSINFCAIGVNYVKDARPMSPRPTLPPASLPSAMTSPTALPTPISTGSDYAVPPITWSALSYYSAFEKTPEVSLGGCNWRNDGVDAQPSADSVCRERDKATCSVGWWDAEEYLLYRFTIPFGRTGEYDFRVRAASSRAGRHLGMKLTKSDGSSIASYETYEVPGSGWKIFDDLYWTNVNMNPGDFILKIYSTTGNINVCSVAILPSNDTDGVGDPLPDDSSQVVVPGFYSAMFYTEGSNDNNGDNIGNCPIRKDSPIDAKTVNDPICKEAVTDFGQHCQIAFTESDEFLIYDVANSVGKSSLKITLRVASYRSRNMRIELFTIDGTILLARKDISTTARQDWNAFETITVWNSVNVRNVDSFKIKVTFLNGQVNLCAFGVE
jgi:hypothetical protein